MKAKIYTVNVELLVNARGEIDALRKTVDAIRSARNHLPQNVLGNRKEVEAARILGSTFYVGATKV